MINGVLFLQKFNIFFPQFTIYKMYGCDILGDLSDFL